VNTLKRFGMVAAFVALAAAVVIAGGDMTGEWLYGNSGDQVLGLGSSATIKMSSATTGYGSFDTGLARSAAGTLKITNGSTGSGALDLSGLTMHGVTANAYAYSDPAANSWRFYGPMRVDQNTLPTRYSLRWAAGFRGKPGINADATSATDATREAADMFFEVLGTNAVSADTAYYAEGGITLTTHGASADSTILVPHLGTNLSPWKQITWGTSKQVEWECDISTATQITSTSIWAGLKLTNTPTVATDDDQAYFYYDSATNSGKWEAVSSIAGTDLESDTGLTVAVSTRYHLKITIDSSRVARFYANGVLYKTTAALTSVNLIPYIGVKQTAGSITRSVNVHGQAISRTIG